MAPINQIKEIGGWMERVEEINVFPHTSLIFQY